MTDGSTPLACAVAAPSYAITVEQTVPRASAAPGDRLSPLRPLSRRAHAAAGEEPEGDGEEAVRQASWPRQFGACGHVVCSACAVWSYLDALEEAYYTLDEGSGAAVAATFFKPPKLTEAVFLRFIGHRFAARCVVRTPAPPAYTCVVACVCRDGRDANVRCPVLTCSVQSPVPAGESVANALPLMPQVGKAASSRLMEW